MGRVGSALDNAAIDSWHSTLEFELRRLEHFTTRAQARQAVAAWIEDYNHDRRHSALGMLCPVAYEQALRTRTAHQPGAGGVTGPLPAHPWWRRPRRGQGHALRVGLRPSPDPNRGRRPNRSYREQVRKPRSTKFRSPRFEGIAARKVPAPPGCSAPADSLSAGSGTASSCDSRARYPTFYIRQTRHALDTD